MAPKKSRAKQLPKAPLVEVVFELRWALQGAPLPPVMQSDPGLLPLLDSFSAGVKKQKFSSFKDVAHPMQTGGHGIVRRFYKRDDLPFPVLQIGPGIFASNEGPNYSWPDFKKQTLSAMTIAIASYPKLKFFAFAPISLELKYTDVFTKSILGNAALFHFTQNATSLRFALPEMLNNPEIFSGDAEGRFIFRRSLKGLKNNIFDVDVASAKKNDTRDDVVQMTSRVFCDGAGVPKFTSAKKFVSDVGDWLEFAHGITSPFFRQFILPDIMTKFAEA